MIITSNFDERKLSTIKGLLFFVIALITTSCQQSASSQTPSSALYETDVFKKYWFSGMAEINSYDLQQSRYGETREGSAVLIFVTEDFSGNKHVKLDQPNGADKIGVLKLNFTKNFVTGIYPYSLMLSTFTPIEAKPSPQTLKVTMSSQEWCGQVYAQLNFRNQKYQLVSHSYFEQEGDQQTVYKPVVLEDEIWNRIRLNPSALPQGEIEILPGLFHSRLLHVPLSVQKATATLLAEKETNRYTLTFPALKRSLIIHFARKFPHRIIRWEERFQERGKEVITRATLLKSIRTDYWTKNKNEYLPLRDSLGLSRKNY